MAGRTRKSGAKGKAGNRKLSVKKLSVRDAAPSKASDVRGGASLRIRRD